ncbi:MAG: hypothetical protein Q9167_002358 [Letrouitia subvulpina]
MSTSESSVQKQWDIGQSAFLAGAAVVALLRAASQDDVQPQAILAMEALGAGLLVHQERIGEGIDALSGGESRRLGVKLKLLIGLNNGGVAREMRKSVPCVASFMMAIACKTCFTDQEAGSILYEMMNLRGVLSKVPLSRGQVEQFIEAISGYGYKIIPTDLFNHVSENVRRSQNDNPLAMPRLFSSSKAEELAEILSNVFEALQDMNVKKLTLEGDQTGIWLSSVFIWLFPADVEILLRGHVIHGVPSSRVKVTLNSRDDGGWYIQKWYSEKRIMDLIVGGFDNVPTVQHRQLPLSHQPIGSAKASLAAAYRLLDDAIEATGHIAAALVDTAFEHGYLRGSYVSGLSEVAFKDICQEHFVSNYHTITRTFGWQADSGNMKTERSKIVAAYKSWMNGVERDKILANGNGALHSTRVQDMRRLLLHIENQFFEDHGYPMIPENNLEHMNIMDPVIHIAAEALYCSIFENNPIHRPFRPLTFQILNANAETLWHLLCGQPSSSDNGLHRFRAEAVKSVLPGSTQVKATDLAVVSNGLVAYSAQLGQVSTMKRLSSAIVVIPGYLRWGDDHALFHKLQEKDQADFPASRPFYSSNERLEVFHNGTYMGLEVPSNSEAVEVKTLISPSGKDLTLTTYLTSPSLQDAPVAVNWQHSIDALVFSEHVYDHDMTALGEECLAQSWEAQKLFDTMAWLGIGGNTSGSSLTRFINTTNSNEDQRFFEAGRMFMKRKALIRHSAPLLQCIRIAMDRWDQWAIIT